jgi:hypothetical protein
MSLFYNYIINLMVTIRNNTIESYFTKIGSNQSLGLIVPEISNIYKLERIMCSNFETNPSKPCDGCGFCACSPCCC